MGRLGTAYELASAARCLLPTRPASSLVSTCQWMGALPPGKAHSAEKCGRCSLVDVVDEPNLAGVFDPPSRSVEQVRAAASGGSRSGSHRARVLVFLS